MAVCRPRSGAPERLPIILDSGRGEFPKILPGDRMQLLEEDGCQLPLFTDKAVAYLLKVAQELVSLPLSK